MYNLHQSVQFGMCYELYVNMFTRGLKKTKEEYKGDEIELIVFFFFWLTRVILVQD